MCVPCMLEGYKVHSPSPCLSSSSKPRPNPGKGFTFLYRFMKVTLNTGYSHVATLSPHHAFFVFGKNNNKMNWSFI